jgi:surfactin synthase thioesterase subunit
MTQERAGAMQCTAPAHSRERALAVAGAEAYRRDVPKAEVHLFEGGHFLLEEHAEAVATLIRKFFGAERDAQRR